jgi:hypothetical protein
MEELTPHNNFSRLAEATAKYTYNERTKEIQVSTFNSVVAIYDTHVQAE